MTDRFNYLTVVLDENIRDDDAEVILNAIRCIKRVISVKGNVANPSDYTAEKRASLDLKRKMLEVFKDY